MEIHRKKKSGKEAISVGELLPVEQYLTLKSGDTLLLKKDPEPGQNAVYDEHGACSARCHSAVDR